MNIHTIILHNRSLLLGFFIQLKNRVDELFIELDICCKVLVMKITHSFTIYVSQRTKELEKVQSMGVQIEINQFHLKFEIEKIP